MNTWATRWVFLITPLLLFAMLCLLPTLVIHGRALGGVPVRAWLVTHVASPLLPNAVADRFQAWAAQRPLHDVLATLLIGLNANALALPFLYGVAELLLRWSGFRARANIELKRRAVRG